MSTAPPEAGAGAVWEKCAGCGELNYKKELRRGLHVCPRCGHHRRLTARQRLLATVDRGSFAERDADVSAADPLAFRDGLSYPDRLATARAKTGRREAILTGTARIGGRPAAVGVFDFAFFGGTMGTAVGERACDRADDPSEAAGGLPARGVPPRARHGRHDRAPLRAAGDARPAARPARRAGRSAQAAAAPPGALRSGRVRGDARVALRAG